MAHHSALRGRLLQWLDSGGRWEPALLASIEDYTMTKPTALIELV